jgi:hypothetical protein
VSERFGARAAVAETHYWLVRRLQDGAVEFL